MAEQFVQIYGQRVGTGVEKSEWRKLSDDQKQRIVNSLELPEQEDAVPLSTPAQEERPEINTVLESFRSAIGQGTLLGFGDEIEAALRTGSISSPEYRQLRDELRAQQDEFRRQNPVLSFVNEVAGGFLLPGGAAVQLGRRGAANILAREAAGRRRNLARAAGRGAAAGVLTGGVAGAGSAEELSDVFSEGIEGALVGGAVGAALPPAASAVAQVGRGAARRLGFGAPSFSDRKVRQALAREGFTPQQAAAEVQRMRQSGVAGATLADLGEQTQNLAFGAQAVANPRQTPVARQLAERFRSQAEEIQDQMARRLDTSPDEAATFLDDLAIQQQAGARQKYRAAYAMDLDVEPFSKYLRNPRFKEIYEKARELSELQQMARGNNAPALPTFDEFQKLSDEGTLPTEFLHQIKRGFDVIIDKGTDPVTGRMEAEAASLARIKKEFNDTIKELNDDYRLANEEFADFEKLKRANTVGKDIDKTASRTLKAKVDKMNDSEKAAFVKGLVDRFNTLVETTGANQDFVRQVFNKGRRRDAIRAAFPDTDEGQEAFEAFEKFMEDQARLVTTNRKVIGGSPTAARQEILRETGSEAGDGIVDILSNPTPSNILRRAFNYGTGMSERAADQTLRTLFSTSPDELVATAARLQRQQDAVARPRGAGLLATGIVDPITAGGGSAAALENFKARNDRRRRNRQGLLR